MSDRRQSRRVLRSIGAFFAGMLASIIPAIATDAALVAVGVFPPLSEPDKFSSALLLLATAYRTAYCVAGSYLTARLAPNHPTAHSLALGVAGLIASSAGAVSTWGVGHAWYPLALVALAMPTAWAGAKLRSMQTPGVVRTA